jgi:hypothetical protein
VFVWIKRARIGAGTASSDDSRFLMLTMHKFLNDMEEKPIRFTFQQLRIATGNFTNLLGAGGFGSVYKGIFSNGTIVAMKVLYGSSDKRIEEQFMAEVSTTGRVLILIWFVFMISVLRSSREHLFMSTWGMARLTSTYSLKTVS